MNEDQIKEKIFEMLNNTMLKDGFFEKRIHQICISGAIDLESFDNDYQLPKYILTSLLKDLSSQFSPLTDEGRVIVKNLARF